MLLFILETSSNSADRRTAHIATFLEMDKNVPSCTNNSKGSEILVQVFCGLMIQILIHKDTKSEKVQKHCKPSAHIHQLEINSPTGKMHKFWFEA